MGSAARRRDAYGGEYLRTGLRLRARGGRKKAKYLELENTAYETMASEADQKSVYKIASVVYLFICGCGLEYTQGFKNLVLRPSRRRQTRSSDLGWSERYVMLAGAGSIESSPERGPSAVPCTHTGRPNLPPAQREEASAWLPASEPRIDSLAASPSSFFFLFFLPFASLARKSYTPPVSGADRTLRVSGVQQFC
jgi:hypothetical protein